MRQANTLNGNGFLEWNTIQKIHLQPILITLITVYNATSDNYTYDPANPRSVAMGSYAVDCRTLKTVLMSWFTPHYIGRTSDDTWACLGRIIRIK